MYIIYFIFHSLWSFNSISVGFYHNIRMCLGNSLVVCDKYDLFLQILWMSCFWSLCTLNYVVFYFSVKNGQNCRVTDVFKKTGKWSVLLNYTSMVCLWQTRHNYVWKQYFMRSKSNEVHNILKKQYKSKYSIFYNVFV